MRIGWQASRSEYSAPRIIIGSNGDFPDPLSDMVYAYFLRFYAASTPPLDAFDLQNESPNKKSTYHVSVIRGPIEEVVKRGAGITHYRDTYVLQCYARRKASAELFPELENIVNEVKRIFIEEFESYAMAGIRLIDRFRAGDLIPPDSPKNPFRDFWMVEARITLHYAVQVLLSPDSSPINGHKYAAGTIRADYI